MQKFRDFLRLLELQVQAMLRGQDRTKDHNRTVYKQLSARSTSDYTADT